MAELKFHRQTQVMVERQRTSVCSEFSTQKFMTLFQTVQLRQIDEYNHSSTFKGPNILIGSNDIAKWPVIIC